MEPMLTDAESAAAVTPAFWAGVERVLDSMDERTALVHEVGPIAARRWRAQGRQVPEALLQQERAANFGALLSIPVLSRARDAYGGRMLVLKGPEVEACYPSGGRLFVDLDLLVDDAPAAHAALLSAGFQELPAARDRRPVHLPAVHWPGSALPIEVHLRPNWPRHLIPPPNEELFAAAVASGLPVDGLEAPAAEHHTLIVAAHAWKHMPLRSVRDLVDVALLAASSDEGALRETADRWNVRRLLDTMLSTADWLFSDGPQPAATRLWARHLQPPREASILERHIRRWVTPFWMLPVGRAAIAAGKNIGSDARPVGDESWRTKLGRTAWVATHPRRTRSERPMPEPDEDF
jgi:hypothetical protein